ncbi:MAG: hypothetical protein HY648_00580 [Acidobacteria bacterium]|nr:hypothetical protein [Acidobacteriota bacterium]
MDRNFLDPDDLSNLDNTQIAYWNGRNLSLVPGSNPNPAYMFTALAIEPGGARRLIRQVGATGYIPGIPGPLTLWGPTPNFDGPNSAVSLISGIDEGADGTDAPAIGTYDVASAANVQASIYNDPPNTHDNYPGSTGPSPSVGTVSVDPLLQGCTELTDFVNFLMTPGIADSVYSGDVTSIPNLGSADNPTINVINGNANLSATDFNPPGYGVLLITGDVTFNGYPDYNGIILIIGTGRLTISGGGSGDINGGIFLANTTTCASTGQLGSPSFLTSGGGNLNVRYNTDYTEPDNGFLDLMRISLNY